MHKLFLVGIILLASTVLQAQSNPWKTIPENQIQTNGGTRYIFPDKYKTFQVDIAQLRNYLASAPSETSVFQGGSGIELYIPQPDGSTKPYEIWESSILHTDLMAEYPTIRTYAGRDRAKTGEFIRLDVTDFGFHALVLTRERNCVYIDPYSRGNTENYICYFKNDYPSPPGKIFTCLTESNPLDTTVSEGVKDRTGDCGNLRTYRLALACTGEYANFHGATGANKTPALSAMTTTMNRVNSVFEIDCGIRMVLISNNSNIIYTDPATDPFDNTNASTLLSQNQTNTDAVIGTANYDIGHCFSTGTSGLATLACPCRAGYKAGACTGISEPIGDPFDIDYVAHEMGHQYGANHTQYNNCNRSSAAAREPGSASSIMGYAGICVPNVQMNSDAYFHGHSQAEIAAYVTGSGIGNSCDVPIANGNSSPSVAALSNYSIPISTAYVLTAVGSDPSGDPITYCWEQQNWYTNPAQTMPPVSTNTSGPMFRTFTPTASPSRYFPRFSDVLSNTNYAWEELSSIGRTLNFRVTVRDNHINGGCTAEQNNTVTTIAGTGPFVVTVPNTNVTYPGASVQTVTWNVANSNTGTVNCANVSISISVDGGASFQTLLASTPNDGSQAVTMPNVSTTQARIMVSAVGNIFYDISDVNFTLTAVLPIALAEFTAKPVKASIQLDWTTESEWDNQGFSVEKSAENQLNFTPIGWVAGQGTSTTKHQYTLTDSEVKPGISYYYRLRQVDISGRNNYSQIIVGQLDGNGNSLTVYPNPTSDRLQIALPNSYNQEDWDLKIWTLEGKLMRSISKFQLATELSVSDLPSGTYSLEISHGSLSYKTVFIRK